MASADPDRDLIERCRADDAEALRELVDRFKAVVYGRIALVTPDAVRAEQLAQDVFLRIHRDLPYFRGEAPLDTWVLRTTATVCPAAIPADAAGPDAFAAPRPAPPVPSEFVVRTLGLIRRDGWRREQMLDVTFNVTIGGVGLATLGIGWYFLDSSGLSSLGSGTLGIVGAQLSGLARNVAPSVPGYVAAVALIGGVLLAWWWAEQ